MPLVDLIYGFLLYFDVLIRSFWIKGFTWLLKKLIFCVDKEFDCPPLIRLQAMDRAHRLGQKKVVNVHRLIMRGTLEEKVMSLQRFKLSVANAVINAENASMKTMNTDQLLDLFASAETSRKVLCLLCTCDFNIYALGSLDVNIFFFIIIFFSHTLVLSLLADLYFISVSKIYNSANFFSPPCLEVVKSMAIFFWGFYRELLYRSNQISDSMEM